MKEGLKHTQTILSLLLIAAMLSTSFLATRGFFNDLVTAKQYGLEVISLIAGALFVVALLSQKEIKFTKTDLLVVLFAVWYVINELYNVNNYAPICLMIFNLFLWGWVYMFVRQLSGNLLFVWSVAIVCRIGTDANSSQIIQNTLGDNHKALGNYPEAEAAYTKSANMIPSLLLPKYLLAKLYLESGQHHKAKKTAEEILNSPVKVESSATREIMNEMKNLVTQSVTENTQRNTE
ncbi:tetratricopeptide repeat protein [Natronoflexus pectinivorans]|uniref:Trafficking protein Mon1 n=1 Tax=Natronoflexus pectinivorans TaxID=682526 RepID=A0A4R2GH29_9BACT|nr:tetratricopeptide repeat protein [Natronoflexus pectinivorans]TCO07329.1 trafficking protein Mon1 [Natronoflexus pectinivorans]